MSDAATVRRTVAVTGAASGIGAAIARAFATDGWRVALIDRDDAVRELAAELGEDHAPYVIDVSSEASIEQGAKLIEAELGAVDALVNNAGVALLGPAADYPTSDWDATIATNLRGVFLCSRTFGSAMVGRGWGRIVNIASQNAIQGIAGHVAYSAAKAGMIGMTQVLVAEWGPHGVTVNCVSPTLVDTPMSRSTWPDEAKAYVVGKIPTRRLATLDDVASAVLYLSGDAAGMINGHNLVVDGGASVTFS
ncbi:SDR family oxidoreductase [Mycolicibacterium mengxianglii]|uniref:SDR family oxidoreductase n=1 Tax=Mycolicibacterium mengxianglii TaxID=2736649 RepID=UPI0018D113DC|nr:SDR family oxidoreductase [Mycolicibacterium mengxianglii]